MKKLKKFYHNNRIYCILMIISIICIICIATAFALFFFNQTSGDAYGNRLNGIDSVTIVDSHKKEIVAFLEEQEIVEKATINIKGKIVYINVYLNKGKTADAQGIAIKTLDKFTEDEKNFYDINYTFVKESTDEEDTSFPIMGYKKSDKTIISWTKVNGE